MDAQELEEARRRLFHRPGPRQGPEVDEEELAEARRRLFGGDAVRVGDEELEEAADRLLGPDYRLGR